MSGSFNYRECAPLRVIGGINGALIGCIFGGPIGGIIGGLIGSYGGPPKRN